MDGSPQDRLDETVFRDPSFIANTGGFVHSNNVLFYFAESPFFDKLSNNGTLASQASYNENFRHILATRESFEGYLRGMQGIEYVVAYDPLLLGAQVDGPSGKVPSNVWVIRKQNRKNRDEATPLASYYVVGDCIYMAPSVLNVVGSRMLSTVTSLSNFFSTSSSLPIFSPSYGHRYIPPAPKALNHPAAQSHHSKESTPTPETQASSSRKSSKPPLVSPKTSSVDYQNNRTLAEALSMSLNYGKEYMDESPLVGEPGNFVLSKSNEKLQARPLSQAPPSRLTLERTPAPTPPPIRTDVSPVAGKKSAKGGDKSPTTPGSTTKDKAKRRKSKPALSPAAS